MALAEFKNRYERKIDSRSAKAVAAGSGTQVVVALGACVLAILGLIGVLPAYMTAISTIVVGAALIFSGAAVAARFNRLLGELGGDNVDRIELGGGVGTEFIGGITGVALGILALIGVNPSILVSVSLLAFGATLLLSVGAINELNALARQQFFGDKERYMERAIDMSKGTNVLIGLATIALGVLALLGFTPMVLNLSGLLVMGAGLMISGFALGGRMFLTLKKRRTEEETRRVG